MPAPKTLHPTERTVTVHIKVPESLHAEFFAECEALEMRGGAQLRLLLRNWLAERKAAKAAAATKSISKAVHGGRHE